MLKTGKLTIAGAFAVVALSFMAAFNQGAQSAYADAGATTLAAR